MKWLKALIFKDKGLPSYNKQFLICKIKKTNNIDRRVDVFTQH